ncbi:hypothetical protein Vadar_006484 [Vaccinium darrowii]|uniref:Uncharacterized protein n=1 Tax=Vaccinium darrowii TaxID=229202 RepID=A0ACB7XFW4_9ERIC|nr:hypothetical protein Vadar_006484 [Vaccinium darrowii]
MDEEWLRQIFSGAGEGSHSNHRSKYQIKGKKWEENGGGSKNAVDDYGEGEKHEIEDQHSQYPMSAALRVEKTGEDCNELNSRLSNGLDSLVEESLIDFGNKTLFNSDNNIDASIKTKGKYGLVLPENEGISSQPNIRSSQIEGINLPVELRPAEIRKRIRKELPCLLTSFQILGGQGSKNLCLATLRDCPEMMSGFLLYEFSLQQIGFEELKMFLKMAKIGRPVHCQNCNNISSLSLQLGQSSSSTSSPSTKAPSPEAPHVARSPERQHRALNVYNLFISEEIKRIKAANPQIKHEAAFKLAKKNWPSNGYEWMQQNGFL